MNTIQSWALGLLKVIFAFGLTEGFFWFLEQTLDTIQCEFKCGNLAQCVFVQQIMAYIGGYWCINCLGRAHFFDTSIAGPDPADTSEGE